MEQICSFWGNIAKAMDIFLYESVILVEYELFLDEK